MSKKTLVVYYSWSCGNTKKIAEQLADAVEGAGEKFHALSVTAA